MVSLHSRYLTLEQIRGILTPLLEKSFQKYGYTSSEIREDETFDGAPVIRAIANVREIVPAEILSQVTSRSHDLLQAQGDERFVFLSSRRPAPTSMQNDDEEDID